MHLKKLEIQGFKSFADRTVLEFGSGVAAVVGPNGSGKSNIADAIRWVLGEQSPRQLRGQKMEDVIFAGSESRRAVGMAEVTLLLDNADGALPIEFSEVSITRRSYRDGENEYLLNNVQCRLRDITELFLDSRVGKDALTVIGQGKIDEILSVKGEERRDLIEEVAGIAKYRQRKLASMRKLADTEDKLVRIRDIIGELAARLPGLAEEARRAELGHDYQQELMQHERALLWDDLKKNQTQGWELERKVAGKKQIVQEAQFRTQELEKELAGNHEQAQALVQELSGAQTEAQALTREIDRLDNQEALSVERRKTLERELAEEERAVQRLCERQAALAGLIAERETEYAELQATIMQATEQQRQCEAESERINATLMEAEALAGQDQGAVLDLRAAVAEQQSSLAGLEGRATEIAQELEEKLLRVHELNTAIDQQTLRCQEQEALVKDLAGQCDQAAADLADVSQAVHRLRHELPAARQELQRISSQRANAQARLQVLERLVKGHEGYNAGVRAVLQAAASGREPFAQGICGAVASLVQAPPEYETAIAVALGNAQQFVVTQDESTAQAAISFLKRHSAGRVTFLPLDIISAPDVARLRAEIKGYPGIKGVAADLVAASEEIAPAVRHLLGRVVVAADLAAAMGWARAKRFNTKVVTLDGEIVHAGGRLTGGKTGQGQDNLLGRERELRKLAAQTGQLAEQEQEQAQRLTEQENELAAAEQRREKLASESHQLAIELQNVRVGAKRAAEELARLRQERDRLQTERRTCELEMEKYREKIDQARERLTHLRQALAEAQLGAQDRHDSLAALRRRRETIGERLNELHVQLATARQAQMSLQERLTELRQEKATHEAAHKACQERSAQIRARLADLGREVDVLAKKRTEAQAALGGVEERLQRLQAHQAALAEQRLDWEREIKRLRTRAETAQRYIHAWEVEIARLQAMVEHVHERLASLGAADAEREPVGDREQRAARIVELQELLEGLGPVNPKAVAEFEAVSERYRFLRKQELDLEQAKGMMHRIIGDMDRQIANRFRQTFAAVQGHFRAIFPRLFTGGQADLVLTDPDNPLDSGVEIVAQPPGKRLTSLLLLSGGERALTAIALLFALLKARPSPFCVLDEIDASLDDANLERFIRFLRSYAEETQFIIITHQKATMEAADSLYGVTMQELGVSRLVSVRLAEAS